ncbi:MAG: hypothetical protein FWD17_19990, partial [Polyangiaceae bacterium]|nr:hypothetical protein [Polyangiaceae bacterium]
ACTKPTVYASNQNLARGLAVDAQRVYWDTSSPDTTVDAGGVFSCPIAGCSDAGPTVLASGIWPYGLAIDDRNLYWVDEWDDSVHLVPKDGSGNDAALIGSFDTNNPLYNPGHIAIDDTQIFINEASNQTQQGIYTVPFSGGAEPTLFYAGQDPNDWPLVVDGLYAYYGETANGAGFVLRVNKTSPETTQIMTGLLFPGGLALDSPTSAKIVYWTDTGSVVTDDGGLANDGKVGRVGSDGTGPVNLVAGLRAPGAVAINGTYVFWNDWGDFNNTTTFFAAGTGYIARTPR